MPTRASEWSLVGQAAPPPGSAQFASSSLSRDQSTGQMPVHDNRLRVELQDAPEQSFGLLVALLPVANNAEQC